MRKINRILLILLAVNSLALVMVLSLSRGSSSGGPGGSQAGGGTVEVIEHSVEAQLDARLTGQVQPLLAQYCYGCHGNGEAEAAVTLDGFLSLEDLKSDRRLWQDVRKQIQAHYMPPGDQPQPTQAQRDLITDWIDDALAHCDCSGEYDPGRVTVRRLNRNEYNHTIRDLVGVDFQPADDFPADDSGYGFDNIGDVLTISPLHVEKYLTAAEAIMDRAIRTQPPVKTVKRRIPGDQLQVAGGASPTDGGGLMMHSNTEGVWTQKFDTAGRYTVRVTAWATQGGDELTRMSLRLGGGEAQVIEVEASEHLPRVFEQVFRAKAGRQQLEVAFINDWYNPEIANPEFRDRNLAVMSVEVEGPLDVKPVAPPAVHQRLVFAEPGEGVSAREAGEKVVEQFATRAFRRPVEPAELAKLMALFDLAREQGENYEASVQLAMTAVLVSPQFLFRVERDLHPTDPSKAHLISDWELASRLSYFLWSSMPDEELFELARAGRLREPGVLQQQVRRMLADGKADALVKHFAGQWLELRSLEELTPDLNLFSTYDNTLRDAMRREAELFFASVVKENRSVLDLIDSDDTFVNGPLARHYGIEGVEGLEFQRVSVEGTPRGGVLTMGAVLVVTSNPTRTSPVKRGKWVLENVLGTPPPPPPPDVPELEETEEAQHTGSIRERMIRHSTDPNCAVCHDRMDPIGFAMEPFDAIGRWREKDGKFAIDASGVLPGGHRFDGPAELKAVILARKSEFLRCFTEKLLVYALGRGLEYYDACAVSDILDQTASQENRFESLVLAIVQSDPFQKRRARRPGE